MKIRSERLEGAELDTFIETAARRFTTTELGLTLTSLGGELHRFDVGSNYENTHKMWMNMANTKDDMELTILGTAKYGTAGKKNLSAGEFNMGQKGSRLIERQAKAYLEFISAPNPTWSYWQEKAWEERHEAKAAVHPVDMAETIAGFLKGDPTGFFKDVDISAFEKYRESMIEVLEDWNPLFDGVKTADPKDKKSWDHKMKWNTNGAHPYGFSISRERFDSIDWPNFRDWVIGVANLNSAEAVAAYMETAPGSVPNANDRVYYLFHRSPDRAIHGVRGLLKPWGAMVTASVTQPMSYGSGVAWKSVSALEDEASKALADTICISADDLKKFDKSLHPMWFQMALEVFWESNFLEKHPHLRAVFAALLHELAQDNWLQVHSSWRVQMRPGLYSGHGLTQWFGSWIHLTLYKFWAKKYSMEPVWQQVLSDDGIQFYNDIMPSEMETLHEKMNDDLKEIGMLLHPEKTKVCDPTTDVYVGQLKGNDVYMHDNTYFLKRNLQRDTNASHGNPIGMYSSLYQTERSPSEKAILEMNVNAALIGYDNLNLGGGPPRAIYDLARMVDVVASGGRGNPLVEDYINLIQTTWPSFEKRGVDYLSKKLGDSWRDGTTTYAGGTLDSGLTRKWVVDALLNETDDYKVWDEIVFRKR